MVFSIDFSMENGVLRMTEVSRGVFVYCKALEMVIGLVYLPKPPRMPITTKYMVMHIQIASFV